jgi:hypothetical protein
MSYIAQHFCFRGSSHRRKSAACPKFDMVWFYPSSIPVGRRDVISSFKLFLPAFATRRGRGVRHPVIFPCWRSCPQTREYIDWRWPLSCVHSVMMVFSTQLGEGEGVHCTPSPFHSINLLDSSYGPVKGLWDYNTRVYLSSRMSWVPPPPPPAKRAREDYMYSPSCPLSPSLCSCYY